VYYDDTEYDYMQHLKPVGEHDDVVLLEAVPSTSKSKEPHFAIRDDPHEAGPSRASTSAIPAELLPSSSELPRNYESQLNVPTAISGFRPDMNPHLRQTLEALEDDEFVDEEIEEDFFGELMADGEVKDETDLNFPFREQGIQDGGSKDEVILGKGSVAEGDGWESRFARFKTLQAQQDSEDGSGTERGFGQSEGGDTVGTLPQLSVTGLRKRRRKTTSDASGYSMSSSSMFRNAGLTTLDEQFDQVIVTKIHI